MLRRLSYALSLKQPWAALVIAGRKSIEVRKWATSIRGRVYIHAAQAADNRPEAQVLVTDDLRRLVQLRGGIIGSAELTGCVLYRTLTGFTADGAKHLNPPEWFQSPRMYGFQFRGAEQVEFVACRGHVRFFTIELPVVP